MAPRHPSPLGVRVLWHCNWKKTKDLFKQRVSGSWGFLIKPDEKTVSGVLWCADDEYSWEKSECVDGPVTTMEDDNSNTSQWLSLKDAHASTHSMRGGGGGRWSRKKTGIRKKEAGWGDHKFCFYWCIGYCFTNLLAQQSWEFNHIKHTAACWHFLNALLSYTVLTEQLQQSGTTLIPTIWMWPPYTRKRSRTLTQTLITVHAWVFNRGSFTPVLADYFGRELSEFSLVRSCCSLSVTVGKFWQTGEEIGDFWLKVLTSQRGRNHHDLMP